MRVSKLQGFIMPLRCQCGEEIPERANYCPSCGLSTRFSSWESTSGKMETKAEKVPQSEDILGDFDAGEFKNTLISFDRDSSALFSPRSYIDSNQISEFWILYGKYFQLLQNDLITQYVKTNAGNLKIDEISLDRFLFKMSHYIKDIDSHNKVYVDSKLVELKIISTT